MLRNNRTKTKLLAQQPAFGMIHSFAYPPIAELIGMAGYDFVMIDGEHGLGGSSEHLACMQAVSTTPATSILRIPSKDITQVRRALDLGFEGIMIPDVRTASEAETLAAQCFYPPRGQRGFSAGTVRASDYGLNVRQYLDEEGSQLLVCLMIESEAGVRNVRAIAKADGVDVIQVGPYDLSYDLGIPGQFDHPKFRKAMDRIANGVNAAGKILGGLPLPGIPLEAMLANGYLMMTVGADVPLLAAGLKGNLPKAPGTAPQSRRRK